jgi:thiol:disulfide interchange protein
MIIRLLFALLVAACGMAQDRVAWSVQAGPASAAPGGSALIRMTAKVQPGWHLYSASSPAGLPASFQVDPGTLKRVLQPPPKRAFDKALQSESETYEGEVAFLLETQIPQDAKPGELPLAVKARFQTCNDTECVPARWTGTANLRIDPAASAAVAIPAGFVEARKPAPETYTSGAAPEAAPDQGLLAFLGVAFGFGLASIFTPCVFPMIPITMSYFLNRQSGGRRDSIVQAVVFCLGIVVLFSGLGLLVTALLGPFGVAQLGASPWVNTFIAVLFLAFGLSLLGAFEITIPSAILTRLNQSSGKGGFAGTLLMGLTFSLASFACVGPFVGTLLAASVANGGMRPVAGMASFATGMALPFLLLALFPAYLKRLPKSGGWMARVKVVLGFIILAAGLKYASSVDQVLQWGLLTRERFLGAWVVLFAMAGLYLLGFVRLEGVKPEEKMGIWRLACGIALVAFALSLLPGMFGARLGELDAYVPEPRGGFTSSGAAGGDNVSLVWMKDDYRGALARAASENKMVFVSFTGYACTNCHWMKSNMFTRPEIQTALRQFVLVELYTDGTDAASEANSQLQLSLFKTSAIPLYAILDATGKVAASSAGATRDASAYLAFLQKGAPPAQTVTGTPQEPPAPVPASAATPARGMNLEGVTLLDGKPFNSAALTGKVVVVNFWATWCMPCIREIPSFNKLHNEFASKGVAVLGVSMDDEGKTLVDPFLKKHPMEYTVALGPQSLGEKLGLDSLPVTLVFDRSGKQVHRFEGLTAEAELQAAIQGAL